MVMLINMLVALVLLPLEIWLVKPRFMASKNFRITEGRGGVLGGASA